MIRFSIVTPSYNQGQFIERTIRSVLDQCYPPMQYVVCDGASSDNTAQVLERYADQVLTIIGPDSGQPEAVNKGIRATTGDVIGWLNSDDTYSPGALPTVAGFLSRYPTVDVVYGDANYIDASDCVIGRYYTESWDPQRLPKRPFLCQPAVFFRRRMIDRFGLLDESLQYTLDYEYWLRLANGGATFAYLPYTLANARVHAHTKTATQGLKVYEELHITLKRYVKTIPDSWILTQTHEILRQRRKTFRTPLDFAVAVIRVSCRLSMDLNNSISSDLLLSSLHTLSAGAIKTAIGLPVVMPDR